MSGTALMRSPGKGLGLGLGFGANLGRGNLALCAALPAGGNVSFLRASSQVVEDYDGNLVSVGNNVPAIMGGRLDGALMTLNDVAGDLLHPYASFGLGGKTLKRLAHLAQWSAKLAKESGQRIAPPGHGKYYVNGADATTELVVNGNFADWTGDNPDGWTIIGESGSDPMVTQVSGGARIFTTGAYIQMQQTVVNVGRLYRVRYYIASVVSGTYSIVGGDYVSGDSMLGQAVEGWRETVFRATSTVAGIKRGGSGGNDEFILGHMSVIEVPVTSLVEPLVNDDGLYYEERVVNGGFDLDYGWTKGSGWAVGSGVASKTAGVSDVLEQAMQIVALMTYRVSFDVANRTGGVVYVRLGGNTNQASANADGSYSFDLTAESSDAKIKFVADASFAADIDNVSCYEIDADGFPVNVLDGGRRVAQTNLLTGSEEINSGTYWGVSNASVVNTDAVVAPNGQTTAETLQGTAYTGSLLYLRRAAHWTGISDGDVYTTSLFLKYDTHQYIRVSVMNYISGNDTLTAIVDVINGTITLESVEASTIGKATIEASENGWFRLSLTVTFTTGGSLTDNHNIEVSFAGSATPTLGTYGRIDRTSSTGERVHLWGFMRHTGMGPSDRPAFEYIPTTSAAVTEQAHTNIQWNVGGLYQDQIGLLVEPAATNKCTCYSFPPADELLTEKVTNGGFDTDTSWAKAASITISDGKMHLAAAISGHNAYQNGSIVAGKVYEVTYTITDYTVGSVVIYVGATLTTAKSAPGTYTERVVGGASPNIAVQSATTTTTLSVDNLSIKEVKWAVGTYATAALPANIDGFTCSGDAAGKLEIVEADAEAEAKFGMLPGWAGKMYQVDNSAGASDFYVTTSGGTGNTNTHAVSSYGIATAGSVYSKLNTTTEDQHLMTSEFDRCESIVATVGATSKAQIRALAGGVAIFAVPQLEESAYVTSPILTSGATGTRAAVDIESLSDHPANNMTVLCDYVPRHLSNYMNVFDTRATSNDEGILLYFGATTTVFRKQTTTSYNVVGPSATKDAVNRAAVRISTVDGVDYFYDSNKATGNVNTDDVGHENDISLGKSYQDANRMVGLIKNFFIFHGTETDANMQSVSGYDN